MSNLPGLALESDPRDAAHPIDHTHPPVAKQMMRLAHDPSVCFEEYVYYAKITRAEEKIANEKHVEAVGPRTFKSIFMNRFSKGHSNPSNVVIEYGTNENQSPTEKTDIDTQGAAPASKYGISESEWKNASRATRTAGWSGIFYLITTDILGPYSVP